MSLHPSDPILEAAREFVVENFLYAHPHTHLAPDDSLLGGGIVDSLGVMELVEWIGSRYGLSVADEEITEENLGTLAAIASFVDARLRASGREAA